MAIQIFAEDILEARIFCYDSSSVQVGENVVHYVVDDVTGIMTLAHLAGLFDGYVSPAYSSWLSVGSIYWGCTVRRLSPMKSPSLASIASRLQGTNGDSQAPLNGAAIISCYSDEPGPSGRGRIFLPFIADESLTDGGSISDAGKAFMDVIGALVYGPGIFTLGAAPDPIIALLPVVLPQRDPTAWKEITRFESRRRVATQRRRGDFGKLNIEPL